jgi:hypothetical protein
LKRRENSKTIRLNKYLSFPPSEVSMTPEKKREQQLERKAIISKFLNFEFLLFQVSMLWKGRKTERLGIPRHAFKFSYFVLIEVLQLLRLSYGLFWR